MRQTSKAKGNKNNGRREPWRGASAFSNAQAMSSKNANTIRVPTGTGIEIGARDGDVGGGER